MLQAQLQDAEARGAAAERALRELSAAEPAPGFLPPPAAAQVLFFDFIGSAPKKMNLAVTALGATHLDQLLPSQACMFCNSSKISLILCIFLSSVCDLFEAMLSQLSPV